MSDQIQISLAEKTAEVVAAYVAQNRIQTSELPKLIASVHDAFKSLGSPMGASPVAEGASDVLTPAVPIKKSVTNDYIISLEDGRKMKTMKRYLSVLGMTPADYRAKWGLPADYPMVAPAYAAQRSALAKGFGLGRKASEEAEQTGRRAPG